MLAFGTSIDNDAYFDLMMKKYMEEIGESLLTSLFTFFPIRHTT